MGTPLPATLPLSILGNAHTPTWHMYPNLFLSSPSSPLKHGGTFRELQKIDRHPPGPSQKDPRTPPGMIKMAWALSLWILSKTFLNILKGGLSTTTPPPSLSQKHPPLHAPGPYHLLNRALPAFANASRSGLRPKWSTICSTISPSPHSRKQPTDRAHAQTSEGGLPPWGIRPRQAAPPAGGSFLPRL